MAEMLAVRLDEDGVLHLNSEGKLVVGDLDIIEAATRGWGGMRQRGRVVVEIYLKSAMLTNTSPDFNGTFQAKE